MSGLTGGHVGAPAAIVLVQTQERTCCLADVPQENLVVLASGGQHTLSGNSQHRYTQYALKWGQDLAPL